MIHFYHLESAETIHARQVFRIRGGLFFVYCAGISRVPAKPSAAEGAGKLVPGMF